MTSLLQDVMRLYMMQLSRVLERAKLLNIKFNPDKLRYRVSEVKYVGQIIPKSGIKPDLDHIKAIVEMPTPKSKTEVRRLLGMMNFLSKFIPNVHKVTAPLREIIHENVEFNWGKEQELSFVNIKELLAKAPILKVFSVNDEIVIQCDRSKDGLGSCLIQKGQSVSFVSRSLTNKCEDYNFYKPKLLIDKSISVLVTAINVQASVEYKQRSGRSRIFNEREERCQVRQVHINPRTSALEMTLQCKSRFGKSVNPETVRNVLRKHKHHGRVPQRKPYISKANRQVRLAFAKMYVGCNGVAHSTLGGLTHSTR
ncbi:retrovirus-related Pol polyprotein from transposon 17.6 [Trichonephila clavipes]|nr:retrovirus-related Pol polyprotein from transposon 17.6 [Trichonephila clavipes]